MSDAKIERVELKKDGSGFLDVVEIRISTRIELHFIDSPNGIEQLSGMKVQLGEHTLMLGDTVIAVRNSNHAIEFCNRYTLVRAIMAYNAKQISGKS